MLTKQGVSLWSSEPGKAAFAHDDVSEATARATPAVELAPTAECRAKVATYTVFYAGGEPKRAALLCDLADGRRMLVTSDDAELALRATREELCGRDVRITADGGVQRL
jgi:hypothetical protein